MALIKRVESLKQIHLQATETSGGTSKMVAGAGLPMSLMGVFADALIARRALLHFLAINGHR